jgi:thioredoxin-related protein
MQRFIPCMRILLVALLASVLIVPSAFAFELIMFRRVGCPWCAAWDREIGPIYAKTEIGQRITLRQLDLDRDSTAALKLASPVRYTPTFVLIDGEREIARIEGYPGPDFFWARLENMASEHATPR